MAPKPTTETGRGDSGVFWNYAKVGLKNLAEKNLGAEFDGNHCFVANFWTFS